MTKVNMKDFQDNKIQVLEYFRNIKAGNYDEKGNKIIKVLVFGDEYAIYEIETNSPAESLKVLYNTFDPDDRSLELNYDEILHEFHSVRAVFYKTLHDDSVKSRVAALVGLAISYRRVVEPGFSEGTLEEGKTESGLKIESSVEGQESGHSGKENNFQDGTNTRWFKIFNFFKSEPKQSFCQNKEPQSLNFTSKNPDEVFFEDIKGKLKQILEEVNEEWTESLRRRQIQITITFIGCLVTGFIFLFARFKGISCGFIGASDYEMGKVNLAGIFLASIGTFAFVSTRTDRIIGEKGINPGYFWVFAIEKLALGWVGAIFLYTTIKSRIIFGFIDDEFFHHKFYSYYSLAFLIGYLQTFLPSVAGLVEKNSLGAKQNRQKTK